MLRAGGRGFINQGTTLISMSHFVRYWVSRVEVENVKEHIPRNQSSGLAALDPRPLPGPVLVAELCGAKRERCWPRPVARRRPVSLRSVPYGS